MAEVQKKVLIVDDEKNLVSLVALHMNMAGYLVSYAYDGYSALDIAKSQKPDVIILDIMLPKLNGLVVCRKLKEAEETRHIPIIILSALIETEDKFMGFNAGADDYITKPFSPRELLARVKRMLSIEKTSRR